MSRFIYVIDELTHTVKMEITYQYQYISIGDTSHASAALVCDGKLVAAAQEERLTRIKHQGDFHRIH